MESSFLIGLIAGILVVLSVLGIEKILKIDDPVGAISVHGVCGAWGTLSLGLFSTGTGEALAKAGSVPWGWYGPASLTGNRRSCRVRLGDHHRRCVVPRH